jgi:hypothetical protein
MAAWALAGVPKVITDITEDITVSRTIHPFIIFFFLLSLNLKKLFKNLLAELLQINEKKHH